MLFTVQLLASETLLLLDLFLNNRIEHNLPYINKIVVCGVPTPDWKNIISRRVSCQALAVLFANLLGCLHSDVSELIRRGLTGTANSIVTTLRKGVSLVASKWWSYGGRLMICAIADRWSG